MSRCRTAGIMDTGVQTDILAKMIAHSDINHDNHRQVGMTADDGDGADGDALLLTSVTTEVVEERPTETKRGSVLTRCCAVFRGDQRHRPFSSSQYDTSRGETKGAAEVLTWAHGWIVAEYRDDYRTCIRMIIFNSVSIAVPERQRSSKLALTNDALLIRCPPVCQGPLPDC